MIDTPYPGLRPFRRDEVNVFFGRDRQIDSMLAVLGSEGHFLAVTGASGAGKSSLVKTGLYSALELGYMRSAGAHWRIVEARPQTHPLTELREAFLTALGDDADDSIRGLIAAAVSRSPEAVAQSIGAIMEQKRESLLIVIDQFEELFRYKRTGADDEAFAFVAMLLQLAKQRKYPIYVVITVRSDYLGECAAFEGLAEAVNKALYLTPQMTRDELGEAITAPAAVYGGSVEPALVARMLNDLERERDQLPLMQHALARLWEEASRADPDSPDLTLAMYEKIGGVTGALEQHANSILAELGPRAYLAERMFRQLVGVTETADDVRNPTQFGQLLALTRSKREDLVPVIEAFRRPDRSFLAPPEGDLEDDTTIDITHESLIRQWPDLREWATAEAADASQYRRIHESARLYRKGQEGLLTSPALENALAWRERVKPTPEWATRHMRDQSKGLGARSVRRQVEHDFAGAMAFLDESERVAKQEREAAELARLKETRRLRFQAISYFALFLVALVGLVLAAFAYNDANSKSEALVKALAEADKLRGDAEVARDDAKALAGELEAALTVSKDTIEKASRAQADYLAASAIAEFNDSNVTKARSLGAEAEFVASRSTIEGLSNRVMTKLQSELDFSGGVALEAFGTVSKLTDTSGFAGDGRWVGLSQAGDSLSVNVWNADTGGTINSVRINSETPWLGSVVPGLDIAAVVKNDGEPVLVSLNEAGGYRLLRAPTDAAQIYALSLGGERGAERALVATFTNDQTSEVQLWDVAATVPVMLSQVPLPTPLVTSDDYPDTAFYDSKAGRFAIVSRDGAILVGSVTNDKISLDGPDNGFLPVALFDSTTRHLHFDPTRNRLIGLIDDCAFAVPLTGLVPTAPQAGSSCDAVGSVIKMASPIIDTQLSDDGLALIAANDASREVIDLRPDSLGETLQYVSNLDAGHPALDVDLASGTIVANNADDSTPTLYQSVVPGLALPCTGTCDVVARLDEDDILYGDSTSSPGAAPTTLARIHTNADGTVDLQPVGQEGFVNLVGINRDRSAVALTDAGMSQIRIYNVADNKQLGTVALTAAQQAPSGVSGSPTGLTAVMTPVSVAADQKSTELGIKLTYSDPETWPAYFVSRGQMADGRPMLAAYSGVSDWLATAGEDGLAVSLRGEKVDLGTELANERPTAMTFTNDGQTLLVGTQRGVVWTLTNSDDGVVARTLLQSGTIDDEVARIDVAGDEVVISGGRAYPSVVRTKLDGSRAPEELEGLYGEWAGAVPTGIMTLGVLDKKDGSPAGLDRLQVWRWDSLERTPDERALAIMTAQSTDVSTETLQELYFIPEFLTTSFRAHFGSAACAEEAISNQLLSNVIGCREALKKTPLASDMLLGHGLQLLRSDAAFSTYAPATFSGMVPTDGGPTTDSIEEGQLFIVAAAASGSGDAMAVLADQLSPRVATSVTDDGSTYSDRTLVPAFGWQSTIDVLERIYADGGPLPSAVVELVTQPIASTTSDDLADPVAASARLWMERIKESKYANDPVAQLAVAILGERSGATAEQLLETYSKLIPQLDRPADQRAAGFAKRRLAALGRSVGAPIAIAALQTARTNYQPRAVASGMATVDPAMKAYIDALSDPSLAAQLRPAAVATALSSFLDLLSPATKASLPPYVELRLLAAKLDAAAPAAELTALASQIISRAYLLSLDSTPRKLVSALLLQLDSTEAPWRTDLERELLQRFAGLIGSSESTYDQQVMASAMRIIARGRDVALGGEQQTAYDAVEHLILRNFDAALDGFAYDSERYAAFNSELWRVAAASERFVPGEDTFVLAMKALIATTDEAVLKDSPVLLKKYLGFGGASNWASGNWSQSIYGYTAHAQAFRQDTARNADPAAIEAEIALLQTGLDLDDLLTSMFSPGMTERLDRASALQIMAYLQADRAAIYRDQQDEASATQSYRDALTTAEAALNFRLAGYNGNSYYGSTMDAIRETYAMMAMVEDRIGDTAGALRAIGGAVTYGQQAWDYDKSSTYLENYLTALTDQLLYLSRQPSEEGMPQVLSTFNTVAAIDTYDRQQVRPGYVGALLSRIAYVLGSQWYALQTDLVPDDCDVLAADPYDPFRRAPGVLWYRLDPLPALTACQAVLDAAGNATDFDKGRILTQLGRAMEAAEQMKIATTGAPSQSYYEQAAALGYPVALMRQLGDASPADQRFFANAATFYNQTLQRIGEPLAAHFDTLWTATAKDTAAWLRSELVRIGDADTHWLISEDYSSDGSEGDF